MSEHTRPEPPFAAIDADAGPASTASARLAWIAHKLRQTSMRITQAQSVAELRPAALQADALIASLQGHGFGIELTMDLVTELGDQLLARLWCLLAPKDLVDNSCLLVMGSEGRGEQTLKTDQDNGLLLRDGTACEALPEIAAAFTAALRELGYPLCPGGIMLSNTRWRQRATEFRETIRQWCYGTDPEGVMQLAILLDARAVAGDARLLVDAKAHLWSILPDSDAFFARFASPVGQFDATPGNWWQWLSLRHDEQRQVVDLKKSGSFQIVHGVRALALKHHVDAVSTRERLRELVELHGMPSALARDVRDALHLLIALRMDHHLRQRRLGLDPDNLVDYRDLGTLEHAQLDSVMAIVKNFRQYLQLHCPFEML
jgi:CBS domain-containing protein